MTPTLGGRIQTRIFLVLIIGGLWTLIIGPFLPGTDGLSLGTTYAVAFQVLLWVAGLGILWELLYHWIMLGRWEKDWPIMYAFFTFINEGALVYVMVSILDLVVGAPGGVPLSTFLVHFLTTWFVTWLYVVGPIRAVLLQYRFNGGKII
jgi:hypothetical protein